MLEVDDIMRFNLFLVTKLLVSAVLNELPVALIFVLIYDGDSVFFRLFYDRSVFLVLFSLVSFKEGV